MNPAIVVVAYNRPESLARLLASIGRAEVAAGAPLVISIDGGGARHEAVAQTAVDFVWPAGEKRVIRHERNLGLIGNVFFSGDLAAEYGRIILLEDDLAVSRAFYRYAQAALDFYADEARVAGISLNALWFNGFTQRPFIPIHDGGDGFFMQVAWYQGQAYTAAQWASFRAWLKAAEPRVLPHDPMHELFSQFPETDWFPVKTKFLVETGRFYVFPRESLTTNFGEMGTHFAQRTHFFQVPLQHERRRWQWRRFAEATAVYDSFQELLPDRLARLAPSLTGMDFDVDLAGVKSAAKLTRPYTLTSKLCRNPQQTWGMAMRPLAANVAENVPGQGIALCRRADVRFDWRARLAAAARLADYYGRGRRPSLRRELLFRLIRWVDRWQG